MLQEELDAQAGAVGKGAAELQHQVHELQAQLAASKQQEERSAQQLREETFKANRLQVGGGSVRVCVSMCGCLSVCLAGGGEQGLMRAWLPRSGHC